MTASLTHETQPKQRLSDTLTDFRPGAFALRDCWMPLVQVAQVGQRGGVRRPMHGTPVYIWRDQGRLRATEYSPRDAKDGRREGSWLSGGTGDLPLVERYGYAWVWYGEPQRAAVELMPNVPHIPVEGMPRRMQGNVVFDCSYELVCENLLDLTHADYLHSAITGDPLSDNDRITVDATSETVTMTRTALGRDVPKAQRSFVKADKQDFIAVTLVHVRSGVCLLHGDFMPGMSVRMLHPCNPETSRRTRTAVSFNVQRCSPLVRNVFPLVAHIVGRQDNWAIKPQNDKYVDGTPHRDENSRFDAAAVRYRKVFNTLVERQQRGDYSYLPDGDPARDVSEELRID
jgi:phenylpropionate dioxygenase-like ring-hydroxylating dioxygenase large terminal subunit